MMNLADLKFENGDLIHLNAASSDIIESAYQHFASFESVLVAPVACHSRSGFKNVDGNETVAKWLSRDARISEGLAIQIINDFPIPVAPRLNQIAMNPCRFLGLASAIIRSPDAIIFSTAGMDPLGIKHIHKYATNEFSGALIHLDINPCEYCRKYGRVYSILQNQTLITG